MLTSATQLVLHGSGTAAGEYLAKPTLVLTLMQQNRRSSLQVVPTRIVPKHSNIAIMVVAGAYFIHIAISIH